MNLAYYLRELCCAWAMGATLTSKRDLTLNTLRFHLANFRRPPQPQTHVQRYAVRLNPADAQPTQLELDTLNGDLFIFYEIFLNQTYFVPPAWRIGIRTIIDLGSHVGLTTLYLSTLLPQARFVCLEPNPRNFTRLQHNLADLTAQGRALLVNGAAGCTDQAHFNATGSSWQGQLGTEGESIDCYGIRNLLDHANAEHVDLIKIDIEGAEAALLADDLDWLKHVRVIMIELHHPYSFAAFSALMAAHDFTLFQPGSIHGNQVLMAVAQRQLAAQN